MTKLNAGKVTSFTESSMEERSQYFGESEKNQMKIVRVCADIYISEQSKEGVLVSESTVSKTNLSQLLSKINKTAIKLLAELNAEGKHSQKNTFFAGDEPSDYKKSDVKAFLFVNNCYDDIHALGERSVIFSFKDIIYSLKDEVDEKSVEKKENLYAKKTFNAENKDAYNKWHEEYLLLKSMIRVVVRKHKLNIKDFINEFVEEKPSKDNKKGTAKEHEILSPENITD